MYTASEFGSIMSFVWGLVSSIFDMLHSVKIISSPFTLSVLELFIFMLTILVVVKIIFYLNGKQLIFDSYPSGDTREEDILAHLGIVVSREERIQERANQAVIYRHRARQGREGSSALAEVTARDKASRGGRGRYVGTGGMSVRKKDD